MSQNRSNFHWWVCPIVGSLGDEASSSTPLPPTGAPQPPGPCCRMNAQLVVRNGILYLYGGTVEQGDKQVTFRDLYKLNLHKLDEWQTIIKDDSENMVSRYNMLI